MANTTTGASAKIESEPESGAESDLGNLPVWDLTEMYSGVDDPKITEDLESLRTQASHFRQRYEGQIADIDAQALADAIATYEEMSRQADTLGTFASLIKSTDNLNSEVQALYARVLEQLSRLEAEIVFFELEINDLDNTHLASLYGESDLLAHYAPWIRDQRRFKPHQLEKSVEEYQAETQVTGASAWVRLFRETQARMRYRIGTGEDVPLAVALNELENHDPERRKIAGLEVARVQAESLPLSSFIVNTLLLDKQISDRLRCFPSPIASRNLANKLEDDVVSALAEAVREGYERISHRYYRLKAGWFAEHQSAGQSSKTEPKLNWWDRAAPIPGSIDRRYSWAEAEEMVLSSWSAFDPRMAELATPFFKKSWIDSPVKPGKDSGAFSCSGPVHLHPYILMNYQGKAGDISTLAHELGHGVHQTLSRDHGTLMCHPSLPLSETASVFGEMLTFQALLSATSDQAERRNLIASKVEDMIGTVVRQISFHTYEERLHAARMEGELSPQDICKIWMSVQSESLGPAIQFDEAYHSMWAYIPHFIHTPFYVYAYAFGDCLVNALYMRYREAESGFADRYFQLLTDSSIKSHTELLEPFGLDATKAEFWQMGLRVIEDLIDELEP